MWHIQSPFRRVVGEFHDIESQLDGKAFETQYKPHLIGLKDRMLILDWTLQGEEAMEWLPPVDVFTVNMVVVYPSTEETAVRICHHC